MHNETNNSEMIESGASERETTNNNKPSGTNDDSKGGCPRCGRQVTSKLCTKNPQNVGKCEPNARLSERVVEGRD
jgi:hypothetical protein